RSDSSGHYVVHGVLPGQWRVFGAFPTSAYPMTWGGNVDGWEQSPQLAVTASSTVTMDLQMRRPGSISGHVVDSAGQPRDDIYVDVYGSTESVRLYQAHTDANGDFTVGNLFAEPVRIAYSAGQPPITWSGNADTFATASTIDVAPAAPVTGVEQVVPRGPHIAGTVTDS